MPIMSKKVPGYPMGAVELREELGYPGRLPHHDIPDTIIGGYKVCVISAKAAREWTQTNARKPHRIMVKCKCCNSWYPSGRLAQHEKSCCGA